MKKFLLKVSLFLLVIAFLYLLPNLFVKEKIDTNNYLGSTIEKNKRANDIKKPALILVGGSNIAFGIDSKRIQDQLGIPVVNLGLHAGLGLSFILNQAEDLIQKDDIVMLSIEYFLKHDGEYSLKRECALVYPYASKYIEDNIKEEVLYHIAQTRKKIDLKTLKKIIKKEKKSKKKKESVYSRASFNKYGDIKLKLSKEKLKKIKAKEYRYWEGIERLNEFASFVEKKGGKVFFAFPPQAKVSYALSIASIDKVAKDINRDLKIEVINNYKDFIFDDSLFYDTEYHLNAKGRKIRTDMMIQLLKNNPNTAKAINHIHQQYYKGTKDLP